MYDLFKTGAFDESFFGNIDETFRRLIGDAFMDKRKFFDVYKNQSQYPKTDVIEYPEHLAFEMAVPGCKKEDIDILLENGIFTIKCEKISKNDKDDGRLSSYRELRKSTFSRSWKISDRIKEEDISAVLENGILRVKLPFLESKKIESKAKKIGISVPEENRTEQ